MTQCVWLLQYWDSCDRSTFPLKVFSSEEKAREQKESLEAAYKRTSPAFNEWQKMRSKVYWENCGEWPNGVPRNKFDEKVQEILGPCPELVGYENCEISEVTFE